jgi:hypothetical protein
LFDELIDGIELILALSHLSVNFVGFGLQFLEDCLSNFLVIASKVSVILEAGWYFGFKVVDPSLNCQPSVPESVVSWTENVEARLNVSPGCESPIQHLPSDKWVGLLLLLEEWVLWWFLLWLVLFSDVSIVFEVKISLSDQGSGHENSFRPQR